MMDVFSVYNFTPRGGDKHMTEFGEWIRNERVKRGYSQTECAAKSGMKVQQWSRMEKTVKRPAYDTLVAIARGLGLSLDDVLRAADYPVNHSEGLDTRLARRLEPLLNPLPQDRRERIERALEEVARTLVSA